MLKTAKLIYTWCSFDWECERRADPAPYDSIPSSWFIVHPLGTADPHPSNPSKTQSPKPVPRRDDETECAWVAVMVPLYPALHLQPLPKSRPSELSGQAWPDQCLVFGVGTRFPPLWFARETMSKIIMSGAHTYLPDHSCQLKGCGNTGKAFTSLSIGTTAAPTCLCQAAAGVERLRGARLRSFTEKLRSPLGNFHQHGAYALPEDRNNSGRTFLGVRVLPTRPAAPEPPTPSP